MLPGSCSLKSSNVTIYFLTGRLYLPWKFSVITLGLIENYKAEGSGDSLFLYFRAIFQIFSLFFCYQMWRILKPRFSHKACFSLGIIQLAVSASDYVVISWINERYFGWQDALSGISAAIWIDIPHCWHCLRAIAKLQTIYPHLSLRMIYRIFFVL